MDAQWREGVFQSYVARARCYGTFVDGGILAFMRLWTVLVVEAGYTAV